MPVGRVETSNEVKSIKIHHESMSEAVPRDNVSFKVKTVSMKNIKQGYITSDSKNKPATGIQEFTAQVIILHHPGQASDGYSLVLDCYTTLIACMFAEILEKIFIVV